MPHAAPRRYKQHRNRMESLQCLGTRSLGRDAPELKLLYARVARGQRPWGGIPHLLDSGRCGVIALEGLGFPH